MQSFSAAYSEPILDSNHGTIRPSFRVSFLRSHGNADSSAIIVAFASAFVAPFSGAHYSALRSTDCSANCEPYFSAHRYT